MVAGQAQCGERVIVAREDLAQALHLFRGIWR